VEIKTRVHILIDNIVRRNTLNVGVLREDAAMVHLDTNDDEKAYQLRHALYHQCWSGPLDRKMTFPDIALKNDSKNEKKESVSTIHSVDTLQSL
jgi:hypothetical protein